MNYNYFIVIEKMGGEEDRTFFDFLLINTLISVKNCCID